MSREANVTAEARVRRLVDAGRLDDAVTQALEHYGQELLGFLSSLTRTDSQLGEDLFQMVCINIWSKLPQFQWKSSLRTWMYTIARNSVISHRRSNKGNSNHLVASLDVDALPARLSRTLTQEWRKTEVKIGLWDAIAELPEEDRMLLMLRLENEMRWSDIAQIFLEDDNGDFDRAQLKRKAAMLRKRYERLKETLRDKIASDAP